MNAENTSVEDGILLELLGGNTRVNKALLIAFQKIMEVVELLNLKEHQAFLTELISTLAAQNMIDSDVR